MAVKPFVCCGGETFIFYYFATMYNFLVNFVVVKTLNLTLVYIDVQITSLID